MTKPKNYCNDSEPQYMKHRLNSSYLIWLYDCQYSNRCEGFSKEHIKAKKQQQKTLPFLGFLYSCVYLSYQEWTDVSASPLQVFICTSRTEPKPKKPGTCPWPHGPQGWSRWGSRWPRPQGCCGQEPTKKILWDWGMKYLSEQPCPPAECVWGRE